MATEWELFIETDESFDDCGTDVAFDASGNLYVSGYVGNDVSWIRKYDESYVEQWTTTYPGILGGLCVPVKVDVDESGNVGFSSLVNVGPGNDDIFFGILDSNGDELWVQTLGGTGLGTDHAGDVEFDPNGDLLLVATALQPDLTGDLWVLKYDLAGVEIWNRTYDGPDADNDFGQAIVADSDANIFVTGGKRALGEDEDTLTIKLDPDGDEIWVDSYTGPAYNDTTQGIGIDGDGNIRVAGVWTPERGSQEMWFRSYSNDGVELWTATYGGLDAGGENAIGADVALNGEAWFAGISEGAGLSGTGWLAKYSEDGTMIWQRRHDTAREWHAVARADDGRVAVAGTYIVGGFQGWEAIWAVYPP